jgi:hypothetical protein
LEPPRPLAQITETANIKRIGRTLLRAPEIAFETTVPLACGVPSPPGRWAALPFEITQQTRHCGNAPSKLRRSSNPFSAHHLVSSAAVV